MDFSWLIYPVSFLIILSIVVTVHEFGHFIVARYFGVKVIRFSIGFGQPLFTKMDSKGTEFCICTIPLGGYVRLLDSRQDEIAPGEEDQDFSVKSPWARLAVYFAGPGINILFAVFVFAAFAMLGITKYPPIVGQVVSGSIAEQAGLKSDDEILSIFNQSVESWEAVSLKFVEEAGYTGNIPIEVTHLASGATQSRTLGLQVQNFMQSSSENPLATIGIIPKIALRPAVIGFVKEGMPADQAGWQAGDRIVALDNKPLDYWTDLYEYVRDKPEVDVQYTLERDGQQLQGFIVPQTIEVDDIADDGRHYKRKVGQIGVGPEEIDKSSGLVRQVDYNLFSAFVFGVEETWNKTRLVIISIGKLITGALSLDNVTGPVTIAEIAGKTAQIGVSSSLNFLGYLSISLGVFNLLPVPLLDGGHIVFILAEIIRGRPVSMKWQQKYMMVGLALLGSLMLLALFNDVTRLVS